MEPRARAPKLDTTSRRRQIAEAALGLISEQGVRGLGMAALARRVGIAPSAIYRHYASRDEVLDAALEFIRERFLANVRRAREEDADPVARLHGIAQRHALFFMNNIAIPRIVFSDDAIEGHPERRARIHRMMRDYLGAIAEIIQEGQQQRRISPSVDAESSALLLLGLIIPAGILRHLSAGRFDVTAHLERVWPAYERALAPPEGTRRRSLRSASPASRRGKSA